jgi:hypothetical protein
MDTVMLLKDRPLKERDLAIGPVTVRIYDTKYILGKHTVDGNISKQTMINSVHFDTFGEALEWAKNDMATTKRYCKGQPFYPNSAENYLRAGGEPEPYAKGRKVTSDNLALCWYVQLDDSDYCNPPAEYCAPAWELAVKHCNCNYGQKQKED